MRIVILLDISGMSVRQASKLYGMSTGFLYYRMRKMGIMTANMRTRISTTGSFKTNDGGEYIYIYVIII